MSILDLSAAGRQPMLSADGRFCIAFNGEIYNYVELRAELRDYPFRSRSDTEVILAAYERWGAGCLDRFIGMFAFLIWDRAKQELFGARDRFGVKPLYYCETERGTVALASEIGAFAAAGIPLDPDPVTWSTYLTLGLLDHGERTFWERVRAVPPGHHISWTHDRFRISRWYDLAERVGCDLDSRQADVVAEEYAALLADSVRLRFRSDVPVGINLSGGLDSSALLALVDRTKGTDTDVSAFTFLTGDPTYDELPWVEAMLSSTRHPFVACRLTPDDVPALAASVQACQFEPFGGLPTLAYARLFEVARDRGVIVLLDGQGMDEQWAGYGYYGGGQDGRTPPLVQGTTASPVRPDCVRPDFARLAEPLPLSRAFPDRLRNLQLRDACYVKIPRALRFNDRVSMRASTELREPFLDFRLVELAMRQPADRKILGGTGKVMLRRIVRDLMPSRVVDEPKRPVQTPQREWLRGPLQEWAAATIDRGLREVGSAWLDRAAVHDVWRRFCGGEFDNGFFVWQWISLGLMADLPRRDAANTTTTGPGFDRLMGGADSQVVAV